MFGRLIWIGLAITTLAQAQIPQNLKAYQQQMQYWQNHTDSTRNLAQRLQLSIDSLKTGVSQMDSANRQVWQEIYRLIESDSAGVKKFMAELAQIEDRLDQMLLETTQTVCDSFLTPTDATLESLAALPAVYGDQSQWPRLLAYNLEPGRASATIPAGTMMIIPRRLACNDYLTRPGDTLEKIASTMPSMTSWQVLFQLNQPLLEYLKITGPAEKLPVNLILKILE
ncbi:LysM peptidoglycan-binding domain-containing protein [candidate division KSB1 bacterium]|nr:LysM peptidoglycan-binding domain-containing protein [candidate division KSB1 bacterium]